MSRARRAAARARRSAFSLDVERYLDGRRSLGAKLRLWTLYGNFRVVACFRYSQRARRLYARNKMRGLLPKLVSAFWRRRMLMGHHAMIDVGAQIGPGFLIMHDFGLFIGPVSIGANCVLHQNVTLGQRVAGNDHGVPTLGDNVWIGPGATITGNITIGSNVTISAGTVLSKSVPDGCLVAGNPGRVIQLDYDNRSIMGRLIPTQSGGTR
jgi:serine acetyltransferase